MFGNWNPLGGSADPLSHRLKKRRIGRKVRKSIAKTQIEQRKQEESCPIKQKTYTQNSDIKIDWGTVVMVVLWLFLVVFLSIAMG